MQLEIISLYSEWKLNSNSDVINNKNYKNIFFHLYIKQNTKPTTNLILSKNIHIIQLISVFKCLPHPFNQLSFYVPY